MEQARAWQSFICTGKVEDYLQYVAHKETVGEHTDGGENQGTDYQGTIYPRE